MPRLCFFSMKWMMIARKLFLLFLGAWVSLFLPSCSTPAAPNIAEVSDIHLEGLSLILSAKVQNPNPRRLVLAAAKATLWLDQTEVATIALRSPIKLPKKETSHIEAQLDLVFHSPSDELRFMFSILSLKSHTLELELSARGRYGLMPFHKKIARAPYRQVFSELGIPSDFDKLFKRP